jgi:para-aminobenzoate synthetase/4-amino-4-deoxychorismate lyase
MSPNASPQDFCVFAGVDPALAFRQPLEVLHASTPAEAETALGRAEALLADGAWIAGWLAYELGAALATGSSRGGALLALGAFERPERAEIDEKAVFSHSALLATVPRVAYDGTIAALQREIRDGNAYQVNYTVPFALHAGGDLPAMYAHYARQALAPYCAFVRDGDVALLSWSPELFLRFDGTRVSTKPMKGTAPIGCEAELSDEKNRAEHLMIVDLLRNDLQRICDGVEVERLFEVERYPTFATMTSTISGELRPGVTLLGTLRAAFPCGSVTGAPKRAAMELIERSEPGARGVYCGSIGFLSPQRRGWFNVAIRTAQIDAATGFGRFDAGGGIVADSTAACEYDEVLLKARFLRGGGHAPPFAILETFAGDADEAIVLRHLARMERTAHAFGCAFDRAAIVDELRRWHAGIVRVRAFEDGRFAISAAPGEETVPVSVCLDDARVWSGDPFLRHKTSWRPVHDAAGRRAAERGCFDAILRNERDEITEGARTTVFAEIEGRLWTPPLETGLLPGILREQLVTEDRVRERTLNAEDLRTASAVYVGNSARGLLRATLKEE